MKITFVQNEKEKAEATRVIQAGLSLRKAKAGTWILPPNMPPNDKFVANRFVVVDSQPDGRDVFVESFDTIDGALLYALGIKDAATKGSWDRNGALTEWGNFV